jgi:hypothetical protein
MVEEEEEGASMKYASNEDMRKHAQALTEAEERISEAAKRAGAVRWTFASYEKVRNGARPGLWLWRDIEVYDADDRLVYFGEALEFCSKHMVD